MRGYPLPTGGRIQHHPARKRRMPPSAARECPLTEMKDRQPATTQSARLSFRAAFSARSARLFPPWW